MNQRIISSLGLAVLAGVSLITPALAVLSIDYISIGNAGNAADITGYGAVGYAYQIGIYEVTNAQYAVFLNAADPGGVNPNGIYNASMGSEARGGISFNSSAMNASKYTIRSSMGDKPVNFVSWYDAARFTNWLANGQGGGSTETGAYTLSGSTGIITRNVGATVYLPSENEWYKAAYSNPANSSYSLYPTQSDSAPTIAIADATGNIINPGANVANYAYGADWNGQNGNVTTVGSAGATSYYGTCDQGGNVWEWNEEVVSGTSRRIRAGYWGNSYEYDLRSTTNESNGPNIENFATGFRVASVPEPTSVVLAMFASGMLLIRRKR